MLKIILGVKSGDLTGHNNVFASVMAHIIFVYSK